LNDKVFSREKEFRSCCITKYIHTSNKENKINRNSVGI
jgi:hypothetical protein